jgi:EAL domain-containing protein (putative c-di-GMP-specific phosphodiesterase class I)
VRIELDDFGSGYASFGHLRDLPLDAVKLDRSLISPLIDRIDARHILRSTAEVIHALGYQIVGEGVEDEAQLSLLRQVGCEIVQGFLYSRPLPADQLSLDLQPPATV